MHIYKGQRVVFDIMQVLKQEYKNGVDLVYEAVGGEMFDIAVNALANRGCLLIIGMMSQYGAGWPVAQHKGLPEKLLKKSATLKGFFLPHHASKYAKHLDRLFELHKSGQLRVEIDKEQFVGIESVPAAVQHLQGGKSSGKVVVRLHQDSGAAAAHARSRM